MRVADGKVDSTINTAEAVTSRLESLISSDRFLLHRRLPPERKLSEELGVSRQKLRQALLTLEQKGIIWRHVGKGTFVGGVHGSVGSTPAEVGRISSLTELLEARAFLEPIFARLAAYRCSKREIECLDKYCRQGSFAQNWQDYDKWDDLFHRALAEASGNVVLIGWMDSLQQAKRESRWHICRAKTFRPDLIQKYSKEHASIVFHLRNRDSLRAEGAMRRHIQTISQSVGPMVGAPPMSASRRVPQR
jgi:DNA-binding FadR family transcriptional regulator